MSHCPICGKRYDLGSRFFESAEDQCSCDYRGKGADMLLEIGSAFDWITPTIELTADFLSHVGKVEYINNDSAVDFAPVEIVHTGPSLPGRLLRWLFG